MAFYSVEGLQKLLVVVPILWLIYRYNKKSLKSQKAKTSGSFYSQNDSQPEKIDSVSPDFKWDEAPYYKSYPFKNGEYKLTMAIKKMASQDWFLVEPSYKKVCGIKHAIVTNSHPEYEGRDMHANTVFVTPQVVPAILEFYDYVVNYMSQKYPMHFKIEKGIFYNHILGKQFPATSSKETDTKALLVNLSEIIEEDVIFLMKENDQEDSEYYFKGGIFAFASGFNPINKINKPLTEIHAPLPGYEEKLKVSMNRFFNRLSPGQFVLRNNFSVQIHPLYYVDDRNKGHNKKEEQRQRAREELDFDNQVHYRSERQVLTRLPKSNAVVFTIRTYLHPMSEFRAEGKEVCERFIGAINGLPKPIYDYKSAGEWSEAVKSYLADSIEQS